MIDFTAFNAQQARVQAAELKLVGVLTQAATETAKAQAIVDAVSGFLADTPRIAIEGAVQGQIDSDAAKLTIIANKLEQIAVLAP